MKHLVVAIIVLINAGNLIAQYSKVDTLISVAWNGTAWLNFSRTISNYDADCRLKTALHQKWNAATGKWIDDSIKNYNYASGNFISETLSQVWLNNSWTNNYRQTYTYDSSFKILSIVEQTWSFDHWSNNISTINKYDNNGFADSVLVQLWYTNDSLENSYLTINTNNSDGTLQQTIKQNWDKATSSWDNYSKYSVVYNSDKTVNATITSLWNYNAASWQFQTRSGYIYTGTGKLLYCITQNWQTDHWVNQFQYTSYYDNYGFLGNVLVEQWDGFDFEKFSQTSYKNNSDGSIYQHLTQYWDEATNTWTDNLRETYSYATSCQLPLKLLLFTATKNNKTVNLNWQTSDEKNLSHFTIQRNIGGADFTSLGDTPAKTGMGINSYAYSDNVENITADKIFYRLKIIDKEELYTYSDLVSVELSANTGGSNADGLKVYPNPAKDQLTVLFKIQNTGKAELRIIDLAGKIIYSNTVHNNPGNSTVVINISAVSKGIYYVLLITDNNIQKTKFVKQ